MTYFMAELNEAKEAIQRVRELHKPIKLFSGPGLEACEACSSLTSTVLGYENWVMVTFCPTLRALDGEQGWQAIQS